MIDIILELGQPKGAAGYHHTQSYVAIPHTLFQHPSIPSRILGRVKSLQLVPSKGRSPLARSVASKSVVKVVAQRPSRETSAQLEDITCHGKRRITYDLTIAASLAIIVAVH